jgi:putative transposase
LSLFVTFLKGVPVALTESIRLHECYKCGLEMDRDENAARNILDRALNEVGLILSAHRGLGDTQPVKCEAFSDWDGVQLSLS